MEIKIVKDKITLAEVKKLAEESYGEMVKAVADIGQGVLAIGGEMHADGEQLLLENGSFQVDLWGFNIYPDAEGDGFLEYVSFINIRPKDNNRSQEISSLEIKNKIKELVKNKIV
jgi:hypothetical protein